MAKTPEEIKKALYQCGRGEFRCSECAYYDESEKRAGCGYVLNLHALAYIQQLEAQNAELTEKAARYDELRGRIRVLRADVFLRQTEPISPTSEKEGKQKAVRRIADSLYDQRAISFRKWLFGCEVVLQGQLQIVKPEPPKE